MQKMRNIILSLLLMNGFIFAADEADRRSVATNGTSRGSFYVGGPATVAGDDMPLPGGVSGYASDSADDTSSNLLGSIKSFVVDAVWHRKFNSGVGRLIWGMAKQRAKQFVVDNKAVTVPLAAAGILHIVPKITAAISSVTTPPVRSRRMLLHAAPQAAYMAQAPASSRLSTWSYRLKVLSLLWTAKKLYDQNVDHVKVMFANIGGRLDAVYTLLSVLQKKQEKDAQQAQEERKILGDHVKSQGSEIKSSVENVNAQVEQQGKKLGQEIGEVRGDVSAVNAQVGQQGKKLDEVQGGVKEVQGNLELLNGQFSALDQKLIKMQEENREAEVRRLAEMDARRLELLGHIDEKALAHGAQLDQMRVLLAQQQADNAQRAIEYRQNFARQNLVLAGMYRQQQEMGHNVNRLTNAAEQLVDASGESRRALARDVVGVMFEQLGVVPALQQNLPAMQHVAEDSGVYDGGEFPLTRTLPTRLPSNKRGMTRPGRGGAFAGLQRPPYVQRSRISSVPRPLSPTGQQQHRRKNSNEVTNVVFEQ